MIDRTFQTEYVLLFYSTGIVFEASRLSWNQGREREKKRRITSTIKFSTEKKGFMKTACRPNNKKREKERGGINSPPIDVHASKVGERVIGLEKEEEKKNLK